MQGFPLAVTVVNTNRAYGDANPAFTVTYSGFVDSDDASVVSGSPAFTTTATNTSTVAGSPYAVSASLGTLTAARYSFTTFVDGQLTVTKRPLTVTANNTSRAYGATDPTFTASYSGFVNSDTSSVVQGAPQFSTTATATSTVAGGPYAITPSLGTLAAANYSFGSFVDGQLSITPAPLSVTADNKLRVVGTANPTFTGVISGNLNGDSFSATYSTSADVNSPVGTYAIVPALVDPDSKAGNYNVALNNGTLTVTNDPAITGQPTGRTNIAGTTATFTVTAITATTVQYQWQKGGVNIANGTDSVLTLANVSQADAVSYSVIVSNLAGSVTSSSAKLTVIDPINITSGPGNTTVPYNTPATFTVQVTGTSPKYQWRKDGNNLVNGGNIAGATTATLSLTNATSADLGNYSVVVTNLAGAVTSGTAALTLSDPGIVTQPASRTNNVGDNAFFSVSAGGATTLTYQWKFNGNNITDATNSALNMTVSDSSKAGSYSVVVTDGNGSITSSDAVLSVFFPTRTKIAQLNFNSTSPDGNVTTGVTTPSIGSVTQTQIGTATANGFNTGSPSDPNTSDNSSRRWNGFPATAPNKTTGLKYAINTTGYKDIAFTCELWVTTRSSAYWRAQCSVDNGTNWIDRGVINRLNAGGFIYFADDLTSVSGAANNTNLLYEIVAEYEFTATGSGTNAYVSVDPTSTFNPTSSLFGMDLPTFLADVYSPPVVQSSPTSQTVNAGDTAIFSASASGPGVTVVWKKDGNSIGAGSVSTSGGVTTSTLTLENVHVGDAGNYLASFSNTDGSGINSSSATLTITPVSLTITSDSTGKVYGDANPTFTGSVSGLLSGDSLSVSYATAADASTAVGSYDITQTIDDPNGVLANYSVTTNNGSLTITSAPLSVTADSQIKATGAANPSLTGSVQGLRNGDNITGTFTTLATDASPAGDYTIVAGISDPDGKAFNYDIAYHNGTLSVVDVPAITGQPANVTKDSGDNAVFTVTASGVSLAYQWYKDNAPVGNAGEFSGALSSSLTIASATVNDAGSYYVVITNAVGSVTSSNATLTVHSAPAITVDLVGLTNNAGTTATFSIATTGAGPLTYTWSVNGTLVSDDANTSGSSTAALTIANLRRAHSGDYSVIVSNVFGTATSATATLAVIDPVIISDPVGLTINGGQTNVFSVTAAGTPTLQYQWYFSNTVSQAVGKLLGKTSPTLTIGPATAASAGGYFCVVSNQLAAPNVVTSAVAVLVVYTHSELIINTDHGSGTGVTAHVGSPKYGTVANHAVLEIGRTYSVKATAASSCIFSNWTDGNGNILTNSSTLKNFVMQSNLVLNANFMTNAVIAAGVEGKYNGLFYETVESQPDIKVASAGLLSAVSVKSKAQTGPNSTTVGYGPVTGKISVDGAIKPFAGIFALDGNLKKSVKLDQVVISRSRLGKPDLAVNLHMDLNGATKQVTGTISNMTEGGWVADVRADLAASASLTHYTMAIDPGTNTAEIPGGFGFGTVTGKTSGVLALGGKVADGQTISQSVAPDVHGKWPLYVKMYNGGGLLLGWLDMNSGAPTGDVTWIKPGGWSSPKNINYTSGFTNTFAVSGSVYNAPAVGTRILTSDSNNYVVTATDIGNGTATDLSWIVNLTTANKFVVLPGSATNALSLTIKAASGEIGMKFRPTGAGARSDVVVDGVVLQGTTNMLGAFQNAGTIGGVTVQPAP
ncbi:MAG: beta strand repeat-containing protein [Limisphaerales bacterium]